MKSIKRTYALPEETIIRFERKVGVGKRSAVLTELLENWLSQAERKRLREEIIQGCRDMADVYLEVEREYHPLEEEVHRGLSGSAKTGRRHPGSARSRRRV
jgi:hypothetical protein